MGCDPALPKLRFPQSMFHSPDFSPDGSLRDSLFTLGLSFLFPQKLHYLWVRHPHPSHPARQRRRHPALTAHALRPCRVQRAAARGRRMRGCRGDWNTTWRPEGSAGSGAGSGPAAPPSSPAPAGRRGRHSKGVRGKASGSFLGTVRARSLQGGWRSPRGPWSYGVPALRGPQVLLSPLETPSLQPVGSSWGSHADAGLCVPLLRNRVRMVFPAGHRPGCCSPQELSQELPSFPGSSHFAFHCLASFTSSHVTPCISGVSLSAIIRYQGIEAQLLAASFISLVISLFPRVSMSYLNITAFSSSVSRHLCNKVFALDFYNTLF